jgi:hypothetical protein
LTRGLDEQKQAEFDFKLNEPPPWEDAAEASEEQLQDDAAAFMAAMAAKQGG